MTVHDIPALNATLNGVATALLTIGFILIKQGRREAHRKTMTAACIVSSVFLVGYVTHKILIKLTEDRLHTSFSGEGAIRTVYYTMLISHIFLAICIAYLVPRTFLFAIKGNIPRHQAWAKWTFPIWYYVSVTGVLVYFFLYQWWPVAQP